jgi:hypothetical protein
MKRKWVLIMAAMLVTAPVIQAQTADKFNYVVSEVALSSFEKLVVDANIDLVLVQDDTLKRAIIEGDEQLVPQIAVTIVNGIMTISSRGNNSWYKGKVQVTVAVKELSKLEVNANATISTRNALHSAKLLVTVNGDCDVHVTSTGKVSFDTADGYAIEELSKTERKLYRIAAKTNGTN